MPLLRVINRHSSRFNNSNLSVIPVIEPSYYQTMTDKKDKNNNSILNNNIDNRSIIVNKENDPEYNFSTHTNSGIKENKEVESIEHIVCKNSNDTLISQNKDDGSVKESTEDEILSYSPTMTVDDAYDGSSTASENQTMTVRSEASNLQHTAEKIQEYLNKECHGNFVTKPLDTHINDFRKLYPEFKKESRLHLGYAFNKVLKTVPPLGKSQQKEDTHQKPAAEKKGIAILKKALQAEKVEATL